MKPRYITIIILALFSFSPVCAQRISRQEYIETYKDIAVKNMKSHGIPASITLAQGCLESGDGNSDLARRANNHFGIKCHGDWKGKTYYKQDDDPTESCFRKYGNVAESFRDHSDFLRYRERYAFLFDLEITDYKGWCYGLKKAGYATAPDYAQKLIKIIEDYQLFRYDREIRDLARKSRKKDILPPSPSRLSEFMVLNPARTSPLYKFSQQRTVYIRNRVAFIIAGDRETYESIAREYRLFKRELLSFNDLKSEIPIDPGSMIYVQRKRNKAARHMEIHVAEEGDTYHLISQKYGIRLKRLLLYNNASAEDRPRTGDEIFLRRKKYK